MPSLAEIANLAQRTANLPAIYGREVLMTIHRMAPDGEVELRRAWEAAVLTAESLAKVTVTKQTLLDAVNNKPAQEAKPVEDCRPLSLSAGTGKATPLKLKDDPLSPFPLESDERPK